MTTRKTRGMLAPALRGMIALGVLGAGPRALAAGRGCQDHRLAVALAPGLPPDQQVFARLCVPEGPPPATVQLLVHGATYSHPRDHAYVVHQVVQALRAGTLRAPYGFADSS